MPFKKGQSGNAAGRPQGATSARLMSARESVEEVFNILQADPKHSLLAFAKNYPRDYYAIWAKLLPTSTKLDVTSTEGIRVIFERDPASKPIGYNPENDFGILGE